jgi:hypothetical protein
MKPLGSLSPNLTSHEPDPCPIPNRRSHQLGLGLGPYCRPWCHSWLWTPSPRFVAWSRRLSRAGCWMTLDLHRQSSSLGSSCYYKVTSCSCCRWTRVLATVPSGASSLNTWWCDLVSSLLSSIKKRDFYFRALGSLVVLSFPQPLSFSSVLHKPLSETLTRSSDGRNPV